MRSNLFDDLVAQARVAVQEVQADAVGKGQTRLASDVLEAFVVDTVRRGLESEARRRISAGERPLNEAEEYNLLERVVHYVVGLGPIEEILADPEVEEIYGHYDYVQVDRGGQPYKVLRDVWPSQEAMLSWIADVARNQGLTERQFNAGSPMLVLRLRSGMRLSAVRDVAQKPMFNLRRNTIDEVSLTDLVQRQMMPDAVGLLLQAAMRTDLMRIIIVGATGAGKTTLARACLDELPPEKNVVILEDTAEIDMWHPVRHPLFHSLEVREANSEGLGAVEMAEMVKQTLRHRPDWFSVGECRDGDTAAEMLTAMTSGHSSLTTVHAESAQGGIAKLALLLSLSKGELSLAVANNLISEGVDLVVHVAKDRFGHRAVTEIVEVAGFDGQRCSVNQIYRAPGAEFGYDQVTTFTRSIDSRLRNVGLDLEWFYAQREIQKVRM